MVTEIELFEDQMERTKRDFRRWVVKYIEIDGGIFEHLLWTVTDLSFLCNEFVI